MEWLLLLAAVGSASGAPGGERSRADRERENRAILEAQLDGEEVQPGLYIWGELVRRHVRGGLVDYDGMESDRVLLDAYLQRVASTDPDGVRAPRDRIAFYLNVYNATTVDLIVRERGNRGGRLVSIREVPNAWTRYRWNVAGRKLSLHEIEHGILRAKFHEPRVHFALVCASRSCPALRSTPYLGRFLEAQLDSAAREFILDPTRNRFTPHDGRVRISEIFKWYWEDFVPFAADRGLESRYGRKLGVVLAYAKRFLPENTAAALRSGRIEIDYLPYDWSLNDRQ